MLTLPKWENAKIKLLTTMPESLMLLMKSKKPLKLSNLSDPERDNLSKILLLVRKLLLCLMNKKLPPELRELRTPKISSLDKNKPNLSLMLLRSSFQNLEPSPHTLPLKSSLNLPNLVHPTQSKLSLKLLHLLTVLLSVNALVFLNNSKLISPLSSMMMLRLKSKLRSTSITL